MTCTPESGTCQTCVGACYRKPGWFLPGEAEKVADYLGITLQELFRTKLGVDWWEDHPATDSDVFLLAPATTDMNPGEEYPGTPGGRCVFLTADARCSIHGVKPHECRVHWCGQSDRDATALHRSTADAWVGEHQRLVDLLGREPYAEAYDPPFGLLAGFW